MSRPRLLFLCQTLPYPPDGGVWIRSYHVLRLLAKEFDVTALCFERIGSASGRDPAQVARSLTALRKFGRVEVFPVPQMHSRVRYVWNHVRSVLTGLPYTTFQFASPAFDSELRKAVATNRFDVAHLDSLADLSHLFPVLGDIPTVGVHHNIESQLLRRRGETQGRGRRTYFLHQARLLERAERTWAPRVTLNVCTSKADADELERLAPGARTAVVPNGVDLEEFQPAPGAERGLVFVGGTFWFPNLDALEFFCTEIRPRLSGAENSIGAVRWVGQATAEEQRRFRAAGVELTGYVDDVRPYIRNAACFIVPLRAGGGTRLKILTAWAMGKAVVSTTVGCEGLEAIHGRNILIADHPEAFAEAIRTVVADGEVRQRLGREGRKTAEETYGWDVIGRGMLSLYASLYRSGIRSSGDPDHHRVTGA